MRKLIDRGVEFIRSWDPESRVRAAFVGLCITLVGWPSTHVLMIVTQPEELTSWAGHVLLAISWAAIAYTAVDVIVTSDVRREQEDGDS